MRLGLAGSGTDIPAYAGKYGGAVLTATIDRYCYALVSETDSPTVHVSAGHHDSLMAVNGGAGDDPPALIRAIINWFGIHSGLSVFLTSELPPYAGMSVFVAGAIALAKALGELQGRRLHADDLARLACSVAGDRLARLMGVADTYSAAIGGINFIQVRGHNVEVERIPLSAALRTAFEARLMLFFTGRLQKNVEPIEEFARAAERNRATVIEALHEMKDAAIALHGDLLRGQLGTVGSWLDDSWRASRRLGPKMTDAWADQWHETAISAGASGGKINGLGGCGSLLVFCEPDRQGVVTKALEDSGLSRIRVSLESEGASLLLNDLGAKVHG